MPEGCTSHRKPLENTGLEALAGPARSPAKASSPTFPFLTSATTLTTWQAICPMESKSSDLDNHHHEKAH
jgi:hypothetical protein